MTTIQLPEYHQWVGSDDWEAHLQLDHVPSEACPGCIVNPMLKLIHRVVYLEGRYLNETWALQDGYGEPGYVPDQGWDWSGIRDSSPAATKRMYDFIREQEGPRP
jgi:hypothetical protein